MGSHSNNTIGLVDAFLHENKEYLDEESKNEEMDSEMPDEYDDEED